MKVRRFFVTLTRLKRIKPYEQNRREIIGFGGVGWIDAY
jgi:hypothetical protein